MTDRTLVSLFCGAGGFDLGFEAAGWSTLECVDSDSATIKTIRRNRHRWHPTSTFVETWRPRKRSLEADALVASPFVHVDHDGQLVDPHGLLDAVVGWVREILPEVVVIQNVCDLRAVRCADSSVSVIEWLYEQLAEHGYGAAPEACEAFVMSDFGVPQAATRYVYVAFHDGAPDGWSLSTPVGALGSFSTLRDCLWELAHDDHGDLANHEPSWEFQGALHNATGKPTARGAPRRIVNLLCPVGGGAPVADWDAPLPAPSCASEFDLETVSLATGREMPSDPDSTIDVPPIWGVAVGDITATTGALPASSEPLRDLPLHTEYWKLTADHIRLLTPREYARLQTFDDSWEFKTTRRRAAGHPDSQALFQVGNSVPVAFAEHIARQVDTALGDG